MSSNVSELSVPERQLEWTGERFLPTVPGQIELEHYHRYLIARQWCQGKAVLDIASGEGYGSALLADVASSVLGVDISAEAIEHARRHYDRSNLKFSVGSCAAIPLDDESVDVIVSFETIEHHDQHEEMMREFVRVLRPEGIAIISSPEKHEYSDLPGYSNPFHVKELYLSEFRDLLLKFFPHVTLFGQRAVFGSMVGPLDGESVPLTTYELGHSGVVSVPGVGRPVYLVAVASRRPVSMPIGGLCWSESVTQDGEEYDRLVNQLKHVESERARFHDEWEQRGVWGQSLDAELNTARTKLAEAQQALIRNGQGLASKSRESDAWKQRATALQEQLTEVTSALYETRRSASWRITGPLRLLARSRKEPWQLIAAIGRCLPLSDDHRIAVRNRLFSRFPSLFFRHPEFANWSRQQQFGSRDGTRVVMRPSLSPASQVAATPDGAVMVGMRQMTLRGTDLQLVTFEPVEAPIVSVIVPILDVGNEVPRCLRSLANLRPRASFEVIAVTSGASQLGHERLATIDGLRLVDEDAPRDFAAACNRGARIAKGRYLAFLRDDSEVVAGWLDELISTLERDPQAGLVGSKIVGPDGRVRAAGGIVWKDGSRQAYGRSGDPADPGVSYLREVDYCPGSSIALRRELFIALGGFDERYPGSDWGDVALAFKIREHGLSVLYQPLSALVQYGDEVVDSEGNRPATTTHKPDDDDGTRGWADALATQPDPALEADLVKDRGIVGHLLVLDFHTPAPDRDAGSVTAANLMRLIQAQGYQVTFIPVDDYRFDAKYTTALQKIGIQVLYRPYCKSVEDHLRQAGARYDGVLMFRPGLARRHLGKVRALCPKARVIYHTSDLHFLRMSREANVLNDKAKLKAAEAMREVELALMRSADATIVHSTVEAELLSRQFGIGRLHVFNWAIDIPGTEIGFDQRSGICFIGGFQHTPNVDAVFYFVDEVLPLVAQEIPDIRLLVIGGNPPDNLRALESDRVTIAGFVGDLAPVLSRMRASVAPLRFGAGTKGKVATSLSFGLPCVGTSIAVEGMDLTSGKEVLVADDPQGLADHIVRVHTDSEIWNECSRAGIEYARRHLSLEGGAEIVRAILKGAGLPVSPQSRPIRQFEGPDSGSSAVTERIDVATVSEAVVRC